MARKCPRCEMPLTGQPRNCPHCGNELRPHDPGRCEFCGSAVRPGATSCMQCGAPLEQAWEHPEEPEAPAPQQTIVISTQSPGMEKQATRTAKTAGCIIAAAIALPIVGAVLIPVLISSAERRAREVPAETLDVPDQEAVIVEASVPDSIYRASIVEDRNTVEQIWPRVLTELPDSCYYPDPYDPVAAFRFTVGGQYPLVRLDASAPIDLVMTLLRLEPSGSISFAGWNEDGPQGQDPSLILPLQGGEYLALVSNYGAWETGEVRFVWSVAQPEVPLLAPDTTIEITLSDRLPKAYFLVDIESGRDYSFETFNDGGDLYLELHTQEGSVIEDDEGGEQWGDARIDLAAGPLHAGRATIVVRPYSYYSPDFGPVRLEVTAR